MKALQDEPDDTNQSESRTEPKVEGTGKTGKQESIGVGKADAGGRFKESKGSSITIVGSGDRSGRGSANSMSLSDAYGRAVLPKRPGQDGYSEAVEKKVCVTCGTEDPGTRDGWWAYTQQQKPICQACARERVGS